MTDITSYEPKNFWKYFAAISSIPRESGHEEKAIDYIEKLAKEKGYKYIRDKINNIIIKVPGTSGMEKAPAVILQAHIDMVCVKTQGSSHDFRKDGIELVIDGDWLRAKDTTLGADDLVGVAAMLGIIEEPGVQHPPLELVITIDEEAGMTGAINLDTANLDGRVMINLDSMDPGIFYIGCAGGGDAIIKLKTPRETVKEGFPIEMRISGMIGGHSGLEIIKGTANANKLMARILHKSLDLGVQMVSIEGGTKRNVIPSECVARFLIPPDKITDFENIVSEQINGFYDEFAKTDPGAKFEVNGNELKTPFNTPKRSSVDNGPVDKGDEIPTPFSISLGLSRSIDLAPDKYPDTFKKAIKKKISDNLIRLMMALPNGLLAMSREVPNLVETSNNMGVIRNHGTYVEIVCTHRSSVKASKLAIRKQIAAASELAGASVEIEHDYPGWQPNMDSKLLKLAQTVHNEMFGNPGQPKAVHAGLETGLLLEKLPDLDIISFGPKIEGAHSVEERLDIPSAKGFYELVKGLLVRVGREYRML